MALRKEVRIIGFAVLAIGAVFGLRYAANNYLPKPAGSVASVPVRQDIPKANLADGNAPTYTVTAPSVQSPLKGACPTMEVLAWNAIGGLSYANGNAQTAAGSLVQKYTGGCLTMKRQDDYGQMQNNMVAFEQSNGQNGSAFVIIMGDGYPAFAAGLDKLIPGKFSAVGAIGFSYGEDKCMLPAEVQKDAQKAKGALIAAVPRDGDWNICVKWASDNGIPINVDQTTYDPEAINFMDVNAFTDADDKLIAHACETRKLVSKGLTRGETKSVCVNGVATWTPGDVDVVEKYSGSIVGVASTHDYAGQMPALIIGNKAWMKSHRDYVVGLLKAADQGTQAIRSSDEALMQMGAIHAKLFGEQDAAYWARYYAGVVGTDHQGTKVLLGGSKVITLQQEADYFGLRQGALNIFQTVYKVFGDYDKTFYPDLMPSYPAYGEVVDTTYLADALKGIQLNTGVVNASFATSAPIVQTVSKKSWHIEFDSGQATIKPESMDDLYDIKAAAAPTDLRIRIDGYTDNTGSAATNTALSEARARAVATWLKSQAPANFPDTRMESRGYGPAKPVADNATAEGRAKNRRVEIILGS